MRSARECLCSNRLCVMIAKCRVILQSPGSLPTHKAINLVKFIDKVFAEQKFGIKALPRSQVNLAAAVLSPHRETMGNPAVPIYVLAR